jgi:hypothetical protein
MRALAMLPIGVHNRLRDQLTKIEARGNARLDALEAGVNRLLAMAGLPLIEPPAEAPAPPAEPAEAAPPDDHQGEPS